MISHFYELVFRLVTSRLERLGRGAQRALALGLVGLLQTMFLLLLLSGLRPMLSAPHEVELVLVGGPLSMNIASPPSLHTVDPTALEIPPVTFDTNNQLTIATNTLPSGSPNVTRPATAIASEHAFPSVPSNSVDKFGAVRLLLSIAADGTVANASVVSSSKSATLDELAIAWVKARWRYQPALENGQPVAVVTTAILNFKRGG